jgi:hypothetical protein
VWVGVGLPDSVLLLRWVPLAGGACELPIGPGSLGEGGGARESVDCVVT